MKSLITDPIGRPAPIGQQNSSEGRWVTIRGAHIFIGEQDVKPIPEHERGQWLTGGCWALAASLKNRFPLGEYLGVQEPDGFVHVGLKLGDNVIDANGKQSFGAFERKWKSIAERSGTSATLTQMSHEQVTKMFPFSVGHDYVFDKDGTPKAIYPSLVGKRADEAVAKMIGR